MGVRKLSAKVFLKVNYSFNPCLLYFNTIYSQYSCSHLDIFCQMSEREWYNDQHSYRMWKVSKSTNFGNMLLRCSRWVVSPSGLFSHIYMWISFLFQWKSIIQFSHFIVDLGKLEHASLSKRAKWVWNRGLTPRIKGLVR